MGSAEFHRLAASARYIMGCFPPPFFFHCLLPQYSKQVDDFCLLLCFLLLFLCTFRVAFWIFFLIVFCLSLCACLLCESSEYHCRSS
ncbi:uncharacterized protein V1518DRAFT_417542 [Limtongia smithiae]|uniref:uncharacterized protein n=1 Tax=Limtongia smithiae TaxID=1125753 RepID=UPI0034CFED20